MQTKRIDETAWSHSFEFVLNEETRAKLRAEFNDAETFFMAMYKWSLLNALILHDEQRKVYLTSDITKGALERPPSVPPSDRVFDIKNLKLRLSEPDIEIDYSGLSDGEHQFMQVFGTVLLFNAPGSLFLFDEPESHFNPEWRTKFNLILDRLPNADRHEYIISTHSPYLVSARDWNVFKFVRDGGVVSFEPVKFETYGAPFDQLLKSLFSINTTIDENAREKLQDVISRHGGVEMKSAVDEFAESKEKHDSTRRLFVRSRRGNRMFFPLEAIDDHPCCRMQQIIQSFLSNSVNPALFSNDLFPDWFRPTWMIPDQRSEQRLRKYTASSMVPVSRR